MKKQNTVWFFLALLLLQGGLSCSLYPSRSSGAILSAQSVGIDNTNKMGAVDKSASIGASIGVAKNGWLHLINLVEGGPAAKSRALLHGDHLVGIKSDASQKDFVMVHDLDKEQILDAIHGEKGSEITLWVVRDFQSYYVVLIRDTTNK